MLNAKFSPQLIQSVETTPAATDLEVILELKEATGQAPSNRAKRIKYLQQSFEEQAEPIKDTILRLGGKVNDAAWINSTISARLPRKALEELSREESVHFIDVDRKIERE